MAIVVVKLPTILEVKSSSKVGEKRTEQGDFAGVLIDGVEGWRWQEFGRGGDGR
jgi:hypothetical protein